MRRHLLVLIGCFATAASFFSAAAFNATDTGARTVSVTVVGDSASYLGIEENGASPHKNFLSTTGSPAKITISFGSATGVTGTGVNPDAGYQFDDVINVTNQGTAPVKLIVNGTATTGSIKVCYKATASQMSNGCYATSVTATTTLAVGSKGYVGIAVNSTGVSGSSFSGNIRIVAVRG